MKIQLAFEKTGDTITFESINSEVVEYYVENLNLLNANKFLATDSDSIRKSIKKLQDSIASANEFIYDLTGEYFPTYTDEECLNQRVLNELHCRWVKSQSKIFDVKKLKDSSNTKTAEYAEKIFHQSDDSDMTPTLGSVLNKLDLLNQYSKINSTLHEVEGSITHPCNFSTESWVEIPNKFDKSLVTNDRYNLILPFGHLGRTLSNKYYNFDNNLEFDDENTFDELLGIIEIKLQRVEEVPYSNQYLEWCRFNKKLPSGDRLNIGYLPDLEEKLQDYRLVLYRNINQANKFELHIL